jgi:hypothetical protein
MNVVHPTRDQLYEKITIKNCKLAMIKGN